MKNLVVIMAGGSGTRLWPLSSDKKPKQFIKFNAETSLFQQTLIRNKIFGKPLVIINESNLIDAIEQSDEVGIEIDIIAETIKKDTFLTSVLGSFRGLDLNVKHIILVPSDHIIDNEESYQNDILFALKNDPNKITAIGVEIIEASSKFGHIKIGEKISEKIFNVELFLEKPNLELAKNFTESGEYLWNTGIYVFNPQNYINLCKKLWKDEYDKIKSSYDTLTNIYEKSNSKKIDIINVDQLLNVKKISLDYAVIENIRNLNVIKSSFIWKDFGSWESLTNIEEKDDMNNIVSGNVVMIDSKNNIIKSYGSTIAALGVSNLVIVKTQDYTLVANKDNMENIKKIPLKIENDENISFDKNNLKPWGRNEVIFSGKFYKVKKLYIYPNSSTSVQYHKFRSENLLIISGEAEIEVGSFKKIYRENDNVYIPQNTKHRITNVGNKILTLLELQKGLYLSEDDIVRLEDKYGRVENF